jgi:hypothetical protein
MGPSLAFVNTLEVAVESFDSYEDQQLKRGDPFLQEVVGDRIPNMQPNRV